MACLGVAQVYFSDSKQLDEAKKEGHLFIVTTPGNPTVSAHCLCSSTVVCVCLVQEDAKCRIKEDTTESTREYKENLRESTSVVGKLWEVFMSFEHELKQEVCTARRQCVLWTYVYCVSCWV